MAVNPKEYLELLKDRVLNKKHKGIKEALVNFNTFEKPPPYQKQVSRLIVVAGEMVKKTATKSKFSQLNDKRFYFPDGVCFFTFRSSTLKKIDEFKQGKGQKIEKYFWEEKENFFNLKKNIQDLAYTTRS